MNCNIIADLLPLYLDHCCSEDSAALVREHINTCPACRSLLDSISRELEQPVPTPPEIRPAQTVKLWHASLLQAALLFVSFALLTFGVAREAATPFGDGNGFWALCVIIPITGFLLAQSNWFFLRLYPSRKAFAIGSAVITLAFSLVTLGWGLWHYGIQALEPFGLILIPVLCLLAWIFAGIYARMLGKE